MDLNEKIELFAKIDNNKIQILSDFDGTLTKGLRPDGSDASNSMNIFLDLGFLDEDYEEESMKLHDEYYKFRKDFSLPIELRMGKLCEWWHKRFELLCKHGLNEEMVNKIKPTEVFRFRESMESFFGILADKEVPVLVFSAGIGNSVAALLENIESIRADIHIISNILEFDEKGKYSGLVDDLVVHTLNKDKISFVGTSYYEEVKERRNIILLGDSISDVGMSENFEFDNIIKIGFFNGKKKDEGMKEKFYETFDLVIEEDGPMDDVIELLNRVFK